MGQINNDKRRNTVNNRMMYTLSPVTPQSKITEIQDSKVFVLFECQTDAAQ